MLKQVRQQVIQHLWNEYRKQNPEVQIMEQSFSKHKIALPALDHLAIIDLPGPHSGRANLCQIFSAIGFIAQGCDYLAEKQNDFIWLTEIDSLHSPADKVLPQVVVADFRPEEMPENIRRIIEKYAAQTQVSPLGTIQNLAGLAYLGDEKAANKLVEMTCQYFSGRDWPIPSVDEFKTVSEFNELLAWVLVFGRCANHFTYPIHLLPEFSSLESFHQFVTQEIGLSLNKKGGTIKGDETTGIAQGSTSGIEQAVLLADGKIKLAKGFIEFVWRFPSTNSQNAGRWDDYFTGFVARHANRVIESLYKD